MGYLYLFIALLAGLAKGFCGKTVSRDMQNFKECTFINLMRMMFCAAIGFLLAAFNGGISGFVIPIGELWIYLLAAASMTTFCVCWMYAYQNEAYMFLSIFTMLGTVVTCLLDYIFYKTPIRFSQWAGMIILLAAVFIMSIYNKGIKGTLTKKGLFLLILGSTGSAVADFSQKIYTREIGISAQIFNFYMYAFGFLILLVIYFCIKGKDISKLQPVLYGKKYLWIYFTMSFCLYLNSVTKTIAAQFLTSAQIYPVLQGANLIASALMAHVLFKEKINAKALLGMAVAFTGLMVMHFL